MARLDRVYTPKDKGEDFVIEKYTIHGDSLGSDHSPVKVELNIGRGERRPTSFKWNASYLKDPNLVSQIKDKWLALPHNMSFFGKFRHIARLYRWYSKEKVMMFKRETLETKEELDAATNCLHNDIHNVELQGVVNRLRAKMRDIVERDARGAATRSRVQWKQIGDKCSRQFFQNVRKKKHQLNYFRA